ncbi:putative NADH-ubiquinone oxidoreductase 12 kDa subunit, mitochondrial [Nemania sp. FL0916]|nr:putative NADH-ubiquinone oxidoreductase 12 kDa subunit, mitochondrial [Nemania sp. FL0916]
MPTPESEAFLARKPTVPPSFDGVDYDDNKRLKQAQDAVIREQWVQVMMGRLVREELSKCYYREGVNHLEKCGPLREKYLQMLKDHKVRGYLFLQQNHLEGRNINRQSKKFTARRAAEANAASTSTTTEPELSSALDPAAGTAAEGAEKLSSCPPGTPLAGLNYFKNQNDPVALPDNEYPEWLWRCLDGNNKAEEGPADDAGDEFSKSKRQRQLAAKRQRAMEARMLAAGNLEALAPKIPLQQQTINMPRNEDGTPEGSIAAQAAREELRKAMRRERKAKIKESNYLKSM